MDQSNKSKRNFVIRQDIIVLFLVLVTSFEALNTNKQMI